MKYGFLDEAGDVGVGPRSSRVLVVAVVLTAFPQSLRREVKRFRSRLRKKKQQLPELKASRSAPAWSRKRLERLAQLEIEVVVIIAEKPHLPPQLDPEELYRRSCAQAVEECLRRSPSLTLRVDKRYTNPTLRNVQERALWEAVEGPGRTLTLEQMDSSHDPALQMAEPLRLGVPAEVRARRWELCCVDPGEGHPGGNPAEGRRGKMKNRFAPGGRFSPHPWRRGVAPDYSGAALSRDLPNRLVLS